jgi:hypothetical protein
MKNAMSEAAGSLGGEKKDTKAKPKKLRTREMNIRRGHEGGYIVKNHLESEDGEPHHQVHEYPMNSLTQVVKHLRTHMPSGESKAAPMTQTPDTDPDNC